MPWKIIRAFGNTDYRATMRYWDEAAKVYAFKSSMSGDLSAEERTAQKWYVAGWKVHLSIFPYDYDKAMAGLKRIEPGLAAIDLVYKYASSKTFYEKFTGEVKGKFSAIYCKRPSDVPYIVGLVNDAFSREGVTPINQLKIKALNGLKNELAFIGGYCFARYGAFCYTNGILDLTAPERSPIRDNRFIPFPRFKKPEMLLNEMSAFQDIIKDTETASMSS